jgi:hypothetical protein
MLVWVSCTLGLYGQAVPELGLLLNFDKTPSPTVLNAMKRELGNIMSAAHLELRWSILARQQSDTYTRAVVFRFHGTCAALPQPVERPLGSAVLAETAVTDGEVNPYADLNCDRVRDFLSDAAPGQETRMGRAMGRVMAHELYHVLLHTTKHGDSGIARAEHSPKALLAKYMRFEEGELDLIHEKLTSADKKTR